MNATVALDRIQAILSGTEWGSETLDQVADVVRSTGRTVADAGAPSPGHEDPLLVCPRFGFESLESPAEPYVVTCWRWPPRALTLDAAKVEAYGEIFDSVKALLEEVPAEKELNDDCTDEVNDATRDAYLEVLRLIEDAL